jgi:hypothetical protein
MKKKTAPNIPPALNELAAVSRSGSSTEEESRAVSTTVSEDDAMISVRQPV